jgi:hypothetical protein
MSPGARKWRPTRVQGAMIPPGSSATHTPRLGNLVPARKWRPTPVQGRMIPPGSSRPLTRPGHSASRLSRQHPRLETWIRTAQPPRTHKVRHAVWRRSSVLGAPRWSQSRPSIHGYRTRSGHHLPNNLPETHREKGRLEPFRGCARGSS